MRRPPPFPGKSVLAAYLLLRLSMEQSRAKAADAAGARHLARVFRVRAGTFAAAATFLGVEL